MSGKIIDTILNGGANGLNCILENFYVELPNIEVEREEKMPVEETTFEAAKAKNKITRGICEETGKREREIREHIG